MASRGFTMIELMITIVLTGIVVGVMASLFGFASVRLSDVYTRSALYDQTNGVADRIETTIRGADSCTTRDSGTTLVCGMPENGVDTDGDGHNDTYYPDGVDSNGNGTYTVGSWVWFYQAGSTGVYGVGSGNVWRAERSNGAVITGTNIDSSFAYYYGANLRYPLATSLTFTLNSSAHTVTFTVTGSTRIGAETSNGATDASSSRTTPVTRTVQWRD